MMTLVLIVLIALFGALVRTVFGFGEALVTMPLLALLAVNLQTSVALIGALGLIVALPGAIVTGSTSTLRSSGGWSPVRCSASRWEFC